MLCSRVQTMLRQRRSRKNLDKQPVLEISAPFNLKHEPVCLPGVSEDELSLLREKAAASRIGIAELKMPRSPTFPMHQPRSPRSPVSMGLPTTKSSPVRTFTY